MEKIERQIQTAIVTGPTGAVGDSIVQPVVAGWLHRGGGLRPGSPRP